MSTKEEAFETAGVVGLYSCALGTWLSPALQNVGLALVILAFALDRRAWRWAVAVPVFWVCVLAFAYIHARGYLAAIEFPSTADLQYKLAQRWSKLTLFVPIAWYLWLDPRRIPRVLVLCGLGLLIGTLRSLDPETIKAVLNGARYGGDFQKPIAYAFYVSVCLLGMTVLAPRWLAQPDGEKAFRWAVSIGTGVLIAALFWLFMAAQSRGPLLALATILPVALLARYWPEPRGTAPADRHAWHIVVAIGLTVLLLGMSSAGLFLKRIATELPSAEMVLGGGLGEMPRDNTTLRLQMWSFGLRKWAERPCAGWGPGSTGHILATDDNPALRHESGDPWDHLHNAYVQTLFSFGVAGFVFVGAIALLLCLGVVKRYRGGQLRRDDTIFLLGNFGLIAVYSLTDFRHLNHDWSSYWLVLAGVSLASGTTNPQLLISVKQIDAAVADTSPSRDETSPPSRR